MKNMVSDTFVALTLSINYLTAEEFRVDYIMNKTLSFTTLDELFNLKANGN